MISGPALPCPKCRGQLEPLSWHSLTHGRCQRCSAEFEFHGFPALAAARVRPLPKALLAAEHATCFFHGENQAETVCESCGRFLCAVCAIDFNDRRLCPGCIATTQAGQIEKRDSRVLYDGIAWLLVLLLPVTLVTAPIALGYVIVGWRKPRSLVSGGRGKLIFAGVLALIEITGWVLLLGFRGH